MAFCHKWDGKNDFAYMLQFFSLISDGLGSVKSLVFVWLTSRINFLVNSENQFPAPKIVSSKDRIRLPVHFCEVNFIFTNFRGQKRVSPSKLKWKVQEHQQHAVSVPFLGIPSLVPTLVFCLLIYLELSF